MQTHILKLPKKYSFKKVGIKGKNFSVADITPRTGICQIETEKGHETTIIELACDFIYYILEGKGHFIIEGKKKIA
jgi:mannose-6-phosphate isomerase-like protein (cupin superfamily)